MTGDAVRVRREPPRFRAASVLDMRALTPRARCLALGGPDMADFAVGLPASSVRVLLPPADGELVVPEWNGNEFLLPDGTRPPIRTLTPLRVDPTTGTFEVEIVLHESGAASEWATSALVGSEVQVSGPGRGYEIADDAPAFLLAADETGLPALSEVVTAIPTEVPITVIAEVATLDARSDLASTWASAARPLDVRWVELPRGARPGEALFEAAASAAAILPPDSRIWAAGEAAAMQRLRKHLFDELGRTRAVATIRGYWKTGRAASTAGDG